MHRPIGVQPLHKSGFSIRNSSFVIRNSVQLLPTDQVAEQRMVERLRSISEKDSLRQEVQAALGDLRRLTEGGIAGEGASGG